jgi:uncharacterized PurR-regulated membrane protein YhhQ (DUF165 family)
MLHEAWGAAGDEHGLTTLTRNMAVLIVAGGVLSFLLNRASGRIAAASCLAFAAAGAADTAVYQQLRRRSYRVRANGSNLAAALADSLIFPAVAFGSFLPGLVLGQWAAKAGGGALWAWLLSRRR